MGHRDAVLLLRRRTSTVWLPDLICWLEWISKERFIVPVPLNTARAREYLKHGNVDALIATSFANVKYFTGYSCWLDPLFKEYMMSPGASSLLGQRSFALLGREGLPVLIAKSLMATDAADLKVDFCLYGDPGLDESLAATSGTAVEKRFQELFK